MYISWSETCRIMNICRISGLKQCSFNDKSRLVSAAQGCAGTAQDGVSYGKSYLCLIFIIV